MVECSFCKNSKSQKYVYTECNHFVCVNCAALRSGQTLICCNKSTILDHVVKEFLSEKKISIMSNLENQYKYEKTDVNKISFDEIQRKLNIINHIQGEKSTKRINDPSFSKQKIIKPLKYDDQIDADEQYKTFQRNFGEIDAQTPIKLISNPSVLIQQQNGPRSQIKRSLSSQKPSNFKTQLSKLKQAPFSIQQFTPVLQAQLDFIKLEFQSIHEYLKQVQKDTLQQIRIYFQEYVKLIQKDYDQGAISSENIQTEKERLQTYLQSTIQKSTLQQVKSKLLNNNPNFDTNFERGGSSRKNDQRDMLKSNLLCGVEGSKIPLQSNRIDNYEAGNQLQEIIKVDTNYSYFENLRLNTMRDPAHILQPDNISAQPATTNRNLDKIYRKLQESRTKLQQRIQLHNQFMNKRCTKMSNN